MYTILSPLINTIPNLREVSPFSNSSASFKTKFMCMSKLFRLPLNSLPPLSLISTWEFNALPNTSNGLDVFTFFCVFKFITFPISSLLVGFIFKCMVIYPNSFKLTKKLIEPVKFDREKRVYGIIYG